MEMKISWGLHLSSCLMINLLNGSPKSNLWDTTGTLLIIPLEPAEMVLTTKEQTTLLLRQVEY